MNPEEQINELESAAALASVGEAYFRGIGMPVNYEEAFRYFRKAAGMGSSAALCRLGNCYENGYGVEQNMEEALSCYEDASLEGEAEAYYRIGDFFWNGVPGLISADRETAAGYYFDALTVTDYQHDFWNAPEVYLRIASCLKDGIGADRDLENALTFLQSAADGFFDRVESGDSQSEEKLELAENLAAEIEALLKEH